MIDNKKKAMISIVGAGPGDKELITVKALKALQKADVILYDALANKELLDEAPEYCRKVYVGKRAGHHKMSQDRINKLMVTSAVRYGHVVRLKGGDPFIFGRGHEELEYAKKHGIETVIIPGISSATSLPLLQQVPLTRRGISESFWVITATKRDHSLSRDIQLASRSTATLVILMGIGKLTQIADILINQDKGSIPVMIVQNGSTPNEKIVLGEANNIVEKAQHANIGRPGIIIIGEVVALHPQFVLQKSASLWRA